MEGGYVGEISIDPRLKEVLVVFEEATPRESVPQSNSSGEVKTSETF